MEIYFMHIRVIGKLWFFQDLIASILFSQQSDPDWLIEQRQNEVEIIQEWMA